jgi:hypothetical protein
VIISILPALSSPTAAVPYPVYSPAPQPLIDAVQKAICPPEADDITPSMNGYGIAPIGAMVKVITAQPCNIDITAEFAYNPDLAPDISVPQGAVLNYFTSVNKHFGESPATQLKYSTEIYLSRIEAAIIGTGALYCNIIYHSGDLNPLHTPEEQWIMTLNSFIWANNPNP